MWTGVIAVRMRVPCDFQLWILFEQKLTFLLKKSSGLQGTHFIPELIQKETIALEKETLGRCSCLQVV